VRLKSITFFAALGAFLLAACGGAPAATWPGLSTDGEFAYLATGQQVHAIRISDGTQAWQFPTVISNTTGIFVADPAIGDDVILVGSEGPTNSYSGLLYGLDKATGAQLWCLSFDQKGATRSGCPKVSDSPEPGLFGLSAAVDNRIIGGLNITNGVAYVGLANGKFYAIKSATGTELWAKPFEAQRDIWGQPLVHADTVFVPSLDHHLYALDAATGVQRWDKDFGAALAGTPTLSDDGATLYVGTFGSQLYALDTGTGEMRWSQPVTATNWIWAGPTLHEGVLYFTDVGGYVNAIDADSGAQVWANAVKPGGLMRARPAIAGDLLYVGDRDGNLYGLDRRTGAVVWTQNLKGQILAPLLIVDETVLVAPFNGDNLLVAYGTAGDIVRWAFATSK
jgi:outer membrane protein assembly factor BamB